MEEEPDVLDEQAPTTFEGIIEDYCQECSIARAEFRPLWHLWWELNGTRLGLLRIWPQTKMQHRYMERFLAKPPNWPSGQRCRQSCSGPNQASG